MNIPRQVKKVRRPHSASAARESGKKIWKKDAAIFAPIISYYFIDSYLVMKKYMPGSSAYLVLPDKEICQDYLQSKKKCGADIL